MHPLYTVPFWLWNMDLIQNFSGRSIAKVDVMGYSISRTNVLFVNTVLGENQIEDREEK
jgi:hypothetical protein